ncbi:hypothetical protein [Paractinoplanes rishiriensis]|uniref:hypothetical protein n=1 Tax=Paractinoplanes rishiriensis TaxID=1050105 RepID=UPI001942DC89|nr:hypothetical protein [Actinoplanes rishiriensis]
MNAIKGTGVRTETTSNTSPYGAANLLDWYAGGSTACTATPTVTFANACDGTFTATLANGRSANAQAIFVVGERRIRLPAGGSTKLRGGKNSTLTIRASNFTTYVGTWGLPDGPCAAPTQPAPTRVASPAAAVPTQGAVTPGPTTTSSAPASGSGGGIVDEAAYGTGPDGTAPASATPVAQATSGMGAGSVLVIVLGLLMIGGGLIVLTKVIRSIRST